MGQVRVRIFSCDDMADADIVGLMGVLDPQVIESWRVLQLMFDMFKSRNHFPLKFSAVFQNYIAFTSQTNYASYLGYAGPPDWVSYSGWLYVIAPESGEVETFNGFSHLALALCKTFPEVCSLELAANMGH